MGRVEHNRMTDSCRAYDKMSLIIFFSSSGNSVLVKPTATLLFGVLPYHIELTCDNKEIAMLEASLAVDNTIMQYELPVTGSFTVISRCKQNHNHRVAEIF